MNITSFESFLSAVCDNLPMRRIRKRVRAELSDHMETALEDFLAEGMDESAAREQVLAEMGDSETLCRELRRAYSPMIRRIRIQRLVGVFAAFLLWMYVLVPVTDELKVFHDSYSLETAESMLSSELGGGALHFLGEVEYNGRLYRYYMPNPQEKGRSRVYCMESVRAFGRNLQNRFSITGTLETDGGLLMDDLYVSACAELQAYTDDTTLFHWHNNVPQEKATVLIFTEPSDVRYFQTQLLPKSEYAEYPQRDALACGETPYYEVSEAPHVLLVTYPADTCIGQMYFLDADKNAAAIQHSTYFGSSTGIQA